MASLTAKELHLLAFLGQVIERFQVLHPNRQFSIPGSHSATELTHVRNNAPTAALAPE
ncbi:MAG: hypothetical protein KME21_24550 [Desmonostoc vinosum HA7617-LM4]|jgi:hypothetical protein|nr:hypothetical protein [Desmonostoc vinosum HA7617-LM4]